MTMNIRLFPILAMALLPVLLGGCSSIGNAFKTVGNFVTGAGEVRTSLAQITVIAKADANATSATAVDLVFIYDAKVPDLLPKDAAKWFAQRDELHANLWKYLDIASVEVPPAYIVDAVTLPTRYSTAVKVVAYANYLNKKGRKVIDLTNFKHAQLTLEAKTVAFAESTEEKS